MSIAQLEILHRVNNKELSVDDADLMLKGLSNSSVSSSHEGSWAFAMFMKDWHEHSSKQYFYKSKDFNQWPPDETATKEELLRKFFN